MLSLLLGLLVNVVTGGSLPGSSAGVHWFAWPLIGVSALGLVVVGTWQSDHAERSGAGAAGAVRPAELPRDAVHIVGRRAELDTLVAAVPRRPVAELGAPAVLGIFGAGGMGKSLLATRLAHTVASRFPDGQVFVELRGATPDPVDPSEAVRRVLYAFGVAAADVPEDPQARQALYRTVLANRRVLLFLDDAAGEEQVRPLLPAAQGCLVLVTARRSLVGLGMTSWCDLGALPEDEALDLLAAVAGDRERVGEDREAAVAVVRYCGSLPLAIAIAGARLRTRPHWSVATLARRLADERRRLDELQVGGHDVRASIELSYADLGHAERRLFRLLSLVDFAGFRPGVASALLGWRSYRPGTEHLLEQLADAKLLEPAGYQRYRFHDLVRIFARERLMAEVPAMRRKAALLRAFTYYLERTRQQWDRLSDPSTGAADRADAEAWFGRTRRAIVGAVRRAEEDGHAGLARDLATAVAPYLETHGYPVDLAAVAEVAARGARGARDRAGLALALRDLGVAESRRSRHDRALAALTESQALWEELGEQVRDAEARHRIGDAHRESGRLDEASAAYLGSIAVYDALGRQRDAAEVQLALALDHLQAGRVDEATAVVEEAAATLGADEPGDLDHAATWALVHRGAVWRAAGRPHDALRGLRRSLTSFRARGERYGSAHALLNLGRCKADLGRTEEAGRHLAESMRLFNEMGNTDGQRAVMEALGDLGVGAGRVRRWWRRRRRHS